MSNVDERVLEVQKWVNLTFGFNPNFGELAPETGRTGWSTMYALTRGLQLEIGIANPVNAFGPATLAACPTLRRDAQGILVMILQGAMWCKGYSPGGFNGTFGPNTESGVKRMQEDAGLNPDGIVTPRVFQAMLNMDAYVEVGINPDSRIRQIQQHLNRNYYQTTGVSPADGHYTRDTNIGLIYALQLEANVPGANGRYGPGTIAATPTIAPGSTAGNFIQLIQFSLYVNGHYNGSFNGVFTGTMEESVRSFQEFSKLPVTGIVNLDTWMQLLVSTGNPERKGQAIDTSETLTSAKVETLLNDGRRTAGRYLTGSYALTPPELQTCYRLGLNVFPIYQRGSNRLSYFSFNQGINDAREAVQAAAGLAFPYDTIIYFTIDFDIYDHQIDTHIFPYFDAIKMEMDSMDNPYRIGVYGPRNACSRVSKSGYSVASFVSGMSTMFTGNIGHTLPEDWSFNQVKEHFIGSGAGRLAIDNNIASGLDWGANKQDPNVTVPPTEGNARNQPFFDILDEITQFAFEFHGGGSGSQLVANKSVLNYLRHENYTGPAWTFVAGSLANNFITEAVNRFGKPSTLPRLYDPGTGVDLDFPHLFATMDAIRYQGSLAITPDNFLADYGGWVGDLITVFGDAKNRLDAGDFSSIYLASRHLIGNHSEGTFPIDDLFADMDAINIAHSLGNQGWSSSISRAVRNYYNVGYQRRFKAAARNRFDNDREQFYNLGMFYLNPLNPVTAVSTGFFAQNFGVPTPTTSEANEVCRAFYDVVALYLDQEV
ncbi:glycoside hydrolase domain-containing protein [Shouchella patagoniensis]|uniref:glycoside hydrolase domain-containing protein n=1 Tax=Shouchella patagoniensis TaxID=228576 RepID=UPI000995093E|nr:glycoside hydrolase domain-containing protein [Shouchella patagoniensis]